MDNAAPTPIEGIQAPLNLWTMLGRVWTFLGRVCYRLLQALFPFLLLAQTALTIWLVGAELTGLLLSPKDSAEPWFGWAVRTGSARRGVVAAVVIDVVLGVLGLLWILPCLYAVWSTWWVARSEVWRPRDTPGADIMRVDEGLPHRRKWCTACKIWRGDRTSHCQLVRRCLPYFDHSCVWWAGAVWAHNVKAYLLFMAILPLFLAMSLAVSIWALFNKSTVYRYAAWWLAFAVLNAVTTVYAGNIACIYLKAFLWQNLLTREWGINRQPVYILYYGQVRKWQVSFSKDIRENPSPWNLGFVENWRQIMGPAWTVLFFWTKTPLIRAAATGQFPIRPDFFSSTIPGSIPLEPLSNLGRRGMDHSRRAATTSSEVEPEAVAYPRTARASV